VYGAGWNQLPIIQASRRQGYRVVAIDRDPRAPGAVLADRFHCVSLRDHDAIVAATRGESLDGVVARVSDAAALSSAHEIARMRGLPTACPELVVAATSKIALAEACASAGLRTPRRWRLGERGLFDEGPIVVRPDVTMRGKAGVRRVLDADALDACLEEAARCSGNGRVDLSSWVSGRDISILVELDRGRALRHAIWDEWVAFDAEGRARGLGCGMPSRFQEPSEEIDAMLAALAVAFAASRCLIVVSLRIDAAGDAHLVEIHLGLGGDGIADRLLPAALPDWDAFACLVRVEAGEATPRARAAVRPSALIRVDDDWRLIEATTVEALYARARASVPPSWELPLGLRSNEETRR
jgi:hypothetical protein